MTCRTGGQLCDQAQDSHRGESEEVFPGQDGLYHGTSWI